MIQNLLMLFVPENMRHSSAAGATVHPPPAPRRSPEARMKAVVSRPVNTLKFVAAVTADAVGFAGLLAGCWTGLQLLQAFLS